MNVAVTFQDGREHTVDQVVLFLYPTGTGVAEERQQIGVRRIRDGRTFACSAGRSPPAFILIWKCSWSAGMVKQSPSLSGT